MEAVIHAMDQRFDCIVIGSDISSLVAAAVLSKAGKKILHLCETPLSGRLEKNGYVFDTDPLPWPGLVSGGLGKEGLRRRGIHLPATAEDKDSPIHQFILPDHRVDLYGDPLKSFSEFQREFAVSPDELQELYGLSGTITRCLGDFFSRKVLSPSNGGAALGKSLVNFPVHKRHGILFRRKLKDLEKACPGLQRIFRANHLLFSNAVFTGTWPFSSGYAFSAAFGTGRTTWGEKEDFLRFLQGFCASGGNISLSGCTVIRFRVKRRIEVDLSLDGESWTVEGERAILSTKWEKLRPILMKGVHFAHLEKAWKKISHTGYPLTLHLGVKEEALPEQAGRSIVLLGDEKHPLMTDSLTYLASGPRRNESPAPISGRALSATAFLNDSPWRRSDVELEDVIKVLFRNVESFLPFLRENLEFLDPSWSMDISRKYQEILNHKYGLTPSFLSPLAVFSSRTPLEQVFLTGGLQYPELGFDGEVLSGIFSADLILGGVRHE